jgi:hypothetical protein
MTHMDKFKARLDEIQRLADAIDRHKTDLMEAAAYVASFLLFDKRRFQNNHGVCGNTFTL